jgi:signal transduction histidine kinase
VIETPTTEVSRHKCLIYDGHPSESLPVIVPFLSEGLRDRRKCLYLGDPGMVTMVESALAGNGIDTAHECRRGALVLSSDRSHLDGGGFDPEAMVAMLCGLIDTALREGFQGLCATGDMTWELGTDRNFERLLEYEARLERVFREKPLTGICQYRRDAVPEHAVQDALQTHRSVYVGAELNRDNLFYMPPELLLEDEGRALREKRGEWMCRQITRILRAEQKRDAALAEQRRLAEQLAETNKDLERRVRERTTDLEAANKELEAFSYSVSHDLRSPLRAIDGFVGMLLEDHAKSLDAEGRRLLDVVVKNARKMGALIDDLLEFSRLGRTAMRASPVDMKALVDEALQELLASSPGRRIETKVAALPAAFGDRTLLRQAWVNLLGNAVKYTRQRSVATIDVGGSAGDPENTYWVKDNGAGFDPRYADKLFGVFQRLHSESEFEGTGVGLALVQRVVNRHGGRVWAEGAPGAGATFTFTLPGKQAPLR